MDLDELYDKLLRYCYMKTRDKYLAEDIVQDTFVRFYENRTYKDTGKELAYMYTIARNLCIDSFRKPRLDSMEDYDMITTQVNETEQLISNLSLEQALDTLSEEQRELIILRFNNELKVTDIGKILGISRFAVHRRIREVMNLLRSELEGEE